MRLVSVLAAATAAGCLSTPPEAGGRDAPDVPACVDGDGDGWFTCGTYVDCADDDPAVHPGGFERADADHDCVPGVAAGSRVAIDVQRVGTGMETSFFVATQTARYELQDFAGHQLGQVTVAATPLLYTATDNNERSSGVHLWENSFSTQATDDAFVPPLEGRGVFRFRVTWSSNMLTEGVSTYTIVADGRVIRTDDFVSTSMGSSITDYVALSAPLVSTVRWEEPDQTEHDVTVTPPASGATYIVGDADGVAGFLCARMPGVREVGFTAISPGPARGLRATVGRTATGSQFALQYDLGWGSFLPGRRVAHAMIWAGIGGAAACVETEIRARSYLTPVSVLVDAGGALGTDPSDFDGDGFIEDGGYWAIAATAGAVEFHMMGGSGAVFGPNNLFRITGLSPTAADPVVRRAGTVLVHGRDYFADLDGTTIWLYTMVSFGADRIEVISPRASCPTCGT